MKIGIDIMGGDFAPKAIVLGAILAYKELPSDCKLVLIGDTEQAKQIIQEANFDQTDAFEFVHTTEIIEMGEHPAKAFAKKQDSSIAVGFRMLHENQIQGFASAGNTGAMLVGTMYTIKAVPGVIRPVITATIPRMDGGHTLLLDVGLNADCKPEVLYQYGILGSLFAEQVMGVENPKVGLLNIGSEEEKGNILAQATHKLMKDTKDFNFIGNVEGNDVFDFEKVDVMVCDGFVGNIVLKSLEACYVQIRKQKINNDYFNRFNFENFGGTPILGVNSNVIIAHGISNDKAIKNMVLQTKRVIDANLPDKFKEIFKND